jgi:hypothetical protein
MLTELKVTTYHPPYTFVRKTATRKPPSSVIAEILYSSAFISQFRAFSE